MREQYYDSTRTAANIAAVDAARYLRNMKEMGRNIIKYYGQCVLWETVLKRDVDDSHLRVLKDRILYYATGGTVAWAEHEHLTSGRKSTIES